MKNIILLILLIASFSGFSQNEWNKEKDQNGIILYTRNVEGEGIKEFKAVMTLKTDIRTLEKILDNYKDFPNWQTNLTRIETIKKISNNQIFEHYFTDLPWPIDNRDLITLLQKKYSTDKKIITYNYYCVPNYLPKEENYLRVKKSEGFWKLTEKSGYTTIIYQFKADPGGNIPDWLINSFLIDGPFETMSNLKKKIK